MSLSLRYRIRLTFAGPVLTHASGTSAFGVDAPMLRHRGRPVLNGSLIRGNLRHALDRFAELLAEHEPAALLKPLIKCWFGAAPKAEGSPDYQERGSAQFDFFWYHQGAEQPEERRSRYRITLKPETGRVLSGALQVAEDCLGVGARPLFEGCVQIRFQDLAEQQAFERWIPKALAYVPALGALKGVGYGRLAGAEFLPEPSPPRPALPSLPESSERLGLMLALDRPFCIGRPRTPRGNRIVSDQTIPGAVLKAAIARRLGNDSQRLREQLCFDELIVTHALPAAAAGPARHLPLPLSLASFGGQIRDLALQADACLLKCGGELWAPAFAPDWKRTDEAAAQAFGGAPPCPDRLLSVRTAIDATGVAAQSQLFSLECIDPGDLVWCADIDLGGVPPAQRGPVRRALLDLLADGLEGIGKTKARARVTLCPGSFLSEEETRIAPLPCGLFLVLLITAARLLPSDLQVSGINGDAGLHAAYADYWRHASGGRLQLSHYFAQQRRAGGEFHFRHYRKAANQVAYRPEWLTVAGSVFVLRAAGSVMDAAECLKDLIRRGLPPALDRRDEGWRSDPYLPQNGYGEIRVNPPRQLALSDAGEGMTYEPI